jgi:hypothetical protein
MIWGCDIENSTLGRDMHIPGTVSQLFIHLDDDDDDDVLGFGTM